MSNPNLIPGEHQQSMQQNAGFVPSETSSTSPPVQYQIQTTAANITQAHHQTVVTNAQQNVHPANHHNFMPQQADFTMSPNVTRQDFATNQQSDYKAAPDAPVAIPAQQIQQPPATKATIQPLLSLESDQGDYIDKNAISKDDAQINNTNQGQGQKSQQQTSPQKTVVTKVKLSDELNIFDWLRTTDIINQIAEKAKSSVDSVITALDPGMKEYLYSGGNINIMVISENDSFTSPIRDVFQTVFGRATVSAAKVDSGEAATSFPIKLARGFNEAIQVAQERIKRLRLDTSRVPQNQVMIAVQPTVVNMIDSDNESLHGWLNVDESSYLTYCLVLEDPVLGLTLTSYSQFIPLDGEAMKSLSMSKLQKDSPHHELGYTITIDDLMNSRLKIPPLDDNQLECQWIKKWAGLDISHVVHDLSSSLAHIYRRKWTDCVSLRDKN